jgi:telomerase protein component 1
MAGKWQTVRVFVCSTFRDMHAERDHLVRVVFPELRERLEKYRVYLIDIDLRWGVTREEAENDRILDVCLHQIDECRPFFVGILGERYGWVPQRFPQEALANYGWVQYHTGKSITELEIIYGVLNNPKMRKHAFFYFREPKSLQGVPEDIRRTVYIEEDPQLTSKLSALKGKIRQSGYPVMDSYPARWDPNAYDRPTRSYGRLSNLSEFGKRIRDDLWNAIKAQLNLPETPPTEMGIDPLPRRGARLPRAVHGIPTSHLCGPGSGQQTPP